MSNAGPNRLVWFLIVGCAALVVVGAWGANRLLGVSVPGHDTTPIPIRVWVAPAAFDAVKAAAGAYNARNPQIQGRPVQVTVESHDGVELLRAAPARLPTAWIMEGTWLLSDVQSSVPQPGFVTQGAGAPQSIARSFPIWGAFKSRAQVLTTKYGTLDWKAAHDAADADNWAALGGDAGWGPVKPAFAQPAGSAQGVGVLLDAAASYNGRADVNSNDVQRNPQFVSWLQTIIAAIPGWNRLGGDPALILATTGRSMGDFGYVLESDWLRRADGIRNRNNEDLVFVYPQQSVVFDFPYAVWGGATAEEQAAGLDFRTYLLNEWNGRAEYGLRSPQGAASGGLFEKWTSAGILVQAQPAPITLAPGAAQAAYQWARTNTQVAPGP